MGIPLMQTIFEDDDNLGIYVVPLLIYHPLQLTLGSLATTKLKAWAEQCPITMVEKAAKEAETQP